MKLGTYEQSLLDGWEEVFKRGQLTLWVLLALKDGPKYMAAIKTFIQEVTNNVVQADDISMYRALRRYEQTELITIHSTVAGSSGPEKKVYRLTDTGQRVLEAFCKRNIIDIFYTARIQTLLEKGNEHE